MRQRQEEDGSEGFLRASWTRGAGDRCGPRSSMEQESGQMTCTITTLLSSSLRSRTRVLLLDPRPRLELLRTCIDRYRCIQTQSGGVDEVGEQGIRCCPRVQSGEEDRMRVLVWSGAADQAAPTVGNSTSQRPFCLDSSLCITIIVQPWPGSLPAPDGNSHRLQAHHGATIMRARRSGGDLDLKRVYLKRPSPSAAGLVAKRVRTARPFITHGSVCSRYVLPV